jgi:hypothetical protein
MHIDVSALRNWRVMATDGEIGHVVDVFFDDERWGARYLVVETGGWLSARRVLLSPATVHRLHGDIGLLHVDLTRDQVRHSPDIDTDQPVSRHRELELALHYGQQPYWGGPMLWGAEAFPATLLAAVPPLPPTPADEAAAALEHEAALRTHLRSARELIGYRVQALDGDAGELDGLTIDDETWAIHGLLIDTRRWWPGGRVVVAPTAVTGVSWDDRSLQLGIDRAAVKAAPAP